MDLGIIITRKGLRGKPHLAEKQTNDMIKAPERPNRNQRVRFEEHTLLLKIMSKKVSL